MTVGDGVGLALRGALCWAVLVFTPGCDALDRGLLDPVSPLPFPNDGESPLPDGSSPADSAAPFDSGGPSPDGSGPIDDAGRDAADDAGDAAIEQDAASDAGSVCGQGGFDCCPDDPEKLEPGECGCDEPETDGDADGTPDCIDLCPIDPDKTAPGACGCGLGEAQASACTALASALRHRYRFDGTGTVITDSVSDADGTLVNATLDGTGTLALAGGTSNQHVDLPDGMISALTDATFEVWLSWTGNSTWERIFDFGDASGGNGRTYLFITPARGGGAENMRATMSLSGTATEVVVDAPSALPTGAVHHVALVVDDQNELRLFLDGQLQGSASNTRRLSQLADVNNWIGRSQYSVDEELGGTYHELRIYSAALSDAEVAASFAFGTDPAFLE